MKASTAAVLIVLVLVGGGAAVAVALINKGHPWMGLITFIVTLLACNVSGNDNDDTKPSIKIKP
jgi:hypothetical protein